MNKNFAKAASLSLGLTLASLPLVGCNMGGGTGQGNQPGATDRQNTQQLSTPDGNANRFLNMDLNPTDNNGANNGINNDLFGRDNGADNNGLLGGNNMGSPASDPNRNNTPAPQGNAADMRLKSANITSQLAATPEIGQANVLVVGDSCLVAYSPQQAQGDANARKNMVINKVKEIDPSITNVIVSESSDIMNKITQITNDMANNKPMDQINNEIMQLMNQAAPASK
ncbi:MAG TPA: sporulation protein [Clostridium sp.]|uniref:Sporulation protein n=2 Tax=Acetivibrio mesophilus TaxID=2487273 RepID=A0A4Q0I1H1_9FIRM|nr:sporulation protein [Clostridium sp. Bc-iso-3]RXE58100.1 sporulation protein [Acetivibrio mesophilus]HHV28013.1 sporulation protein [Clostridium sp.]